MPEEDAKIFGEAYEIYNKWRWKVISPAEFTDLNIELAHFAERNHWQENPLAKRLAMALFDIFDDMYRDGKVPAIPDYFGRSDL